MKTWYKDARREIEFHFGQDADLFCDLLAATSPRKQVRANWRLAKQIYESHKNGQIDWRGCMPCHKANVLRAFAGKPLSGQKVRAFAANLRGNLEEVTVDVWIGRYFGIDKITTKWYNAIVAKIKCMARSQNMKPAELQAILWGQALRIAGREPKSFLGAAFADRQLTLF